MRPPGASTSMAETTARSQTASSALTSMRSAWKVRLAGCPPLRCEAAGTAVRSTSTRRAEVVNGSFSRSRRTAEAMRPAKRSSP